MCQWLIFLFVLVFVVAKPSDKVQFVMDPVSDECSPKCTGIEYECIDGNCYCATGFIQNYFQTGCVKCPDLGERCFGTCCNTHSNTSLQCWHGVCQPCYDTNGNWKCRDTVDQIFLVSTTQVIMGTALILGIVATLVLLFKLCTTANLRALGSRSEYSNRLSIGSLQLYVEQRLRDAPPRYTRSTPSNAPAVAPATAYQNDGFVHDSSIPPPPYTEVKSENNQNTALHI